MGSPFAVIMLAALLLWSCAPGAAPGSSAATKQELEAVLQRHLDATRRGDLAAFQSTIDQGRPAFRRSAKDRFDLAAAGVPPTLTGRIARVEPYLESYVRAYVEEQPELGLFARAGSSGYRRAYFRREASGWVLTEPRKDELGGERKKAVEDVPVEYWGIDEGVIDLVAREALAAREAATRLVPGASRVSFALRVYPTAESAGLTQSIDIAAAHVVTAGDPLVRVFQVWYAPTLDGVADFTRYVLRDQVVGRARDLRAPNTYFRLDWWLRVGIGDRVSGLKRAESIRAACRERMAPSFKQLFDGPASAASMGGGGMGGGGMGGDVTAPTYLLAGGPEGGAFFAYARSMVDYLFATYGERAYWDLVDAYRDTPDPAVTYAKALRVTPDRFFADWVAWLKKTSC